MKFIYFAGEIINVNYIGTIWTRQKGWDYADRFEICIGDFKKRDIMNDPCGEWLIEAYSTYKQQEQRFEELKSLLCSQHPEPKIKKSSTSIKALKQLEPVK